MVEIPLARDVTLIASGHRKRLQPTHKHSERRISTLALKWMKMKMQMKAKAKAKKRKKEQEQKQDEEE